jgi:two-component system, NtrC family, sensor kinase
MKSIASRFVMLVGTAAVAPLIIHGAISMDSVRKSTRQSVMEANVWTATRAAERIDLYVSLNLKVLRALAADLRQTHLLTWQQQRILKNYVLAFPEFREITYFDAAGRTLATSRIGEPQVQVLSRAAGGDDISIAPVATDDDLLPKTTVALRLSRQGQPAGWLVAELSLEQMWRVVDSIRIGELGYALVLAEEGRLIAHGDPDEKRRIARGERLREHPLVRDMEAAGESGPVVREIDDHRARRTLAAAAPIGSLGWTVVVEQPIAEAYAVPNRLERQLLITVVVALAFTMGLGYLWSRPFIRPILALTRGTRAISEGRLAERVQIGGSDEFRQLGDAFNSMADRLVELQEDVRRQERQAMFGRIGVGLVHDLSHPIQNIGNSCRLILKMYNDDEYRQTFKRTVERELAAIRRVLEDLRNVARPIPLERCPLDVNRTLREVVESMRAHVEGAGLTLQTSFAPAPPYLEGDLFALGRVYRNLLLNAIQATAPGGIVTVGTEQAGDRVRIRISDNGCGIPPDRLAAIFHDFVTTKRRGLGLGLAISRKIVQQLDGTITVTSEPGRGTTFFLEFPATLARPAAPAPAAAEYAPLGSLSAESGSAGLGSRGVE